MGSGTKFSTNLQGMALMLLAGFLFGAEFAMVRHATATVHPFEVTFFRNIFGLVVLVPWLFRKSTTPLKTNIFHLHLLRASLLAAGSLSLFFAISITPLARIAALGFLVPIFTTIGAIVFLGERVSVRRWTAILFGFAGTFVIIRPGFESIDLGTVLRLFTSLIFGFQLILMKVMTRTESNVTLIFSQALRIADANVIMPIDFLQLIWAAAFGFVLFAEVPNRFTFIGGFMVFSSTTYIAWRGSHLARRQQRRNGLNGES